VLLTVFQPAPLAIRSNSSTLKAERTGSPIRVRNQFLGISPFWTYM
jgi:hypothetical protein